MFTMKIFSLGKRYISPWNYKLIIYLFHTFTFNILGVFFDNTRLHPKIIQIISEFVFIFIISIRFILLLL